MDKSDTRFDEQGTLSKPGPIGRLVRLGLGALCLYAVYGLYQQWKYEGVNFDITEPTWLISLAVAVWLFPAVVNIGFTKSWGRWPQWVVVIVAAVLAVVSRVGWGSWIGPPLGLFVFTVMAYTFIHLGLSFVLSAILATPGCEMRAIPHLWTQLTGRATKEHYCPGWLDGLDKWELSR